MSGVSLVHLGDFLPFAATLYMTYIVNVRSPLLYLRIITAISGGLCANPPLVTALSLLEFRAVLFIRLWLLSCLFGLGVVFKRPRLRRHILVVPSAPSRQPV